ncbi:hypothetical protein Acr_11g0007200 [Actinidia rufa]|uniref:Uncharacterized protein n=1 Tax=Actinidia rufa TaxID=165716 RepID=A0A7J0FCJ1_9ERIC|nr:hypothetical protein Acr_11g0007200 [Actinidia rufa]
MHSRFEVGDLGNLEDFLPSWITAHLGEGSSSFMTDEITQSPDSPREDPPTPEDVPMVAVPLRSLSPNPMVFCKENKGEDRPADDVPTSSGDVGSFLAYVEGLVIDVIGLVLDQYFDHFENHHPNDVRGEIIEFSELVLKEEVVDCLR